MGKITMGEHSYMEPIRRGNANTITIGKYCSIAEGVIFDSGFNHDITSVSTYPFHRLNNQIKSVVETPNNTIVRDDVYIGEGAIIMSGCLIHVGAVIGARAVLPKNTVVGTYEVWGGVPARFIKRRFSFDQIKDLLEIAWWNWPEEKIMANAHLLNGNNIHEFINLHNPHGQAE